MSNIHMELRLNGDERNLTIDYLKKFKHSHLAKKLLMCCYWKTLYCQDRYIKLKDFLIHSMCDYFPPSDEGLTKAWVLHKEHGRYVGTFFGFPKEAIMEGNLNDVEAMITEFITEEERKNLETEYIMNNQYIMNHLI